MTVHISEDINRDYTHPKTLNRKSTEADLIDDRAEALPLILQLVKLRDERVGRA